MLKEFTINYSKNWSSDGTCYRQTINLRQQTLDRMLVSMAGYVNTSPNASGWLSKPLEHQGSLVFMNLTQRNYMIDYLFLRNDKRLTDANTCINIIDYKDTRDIVNKAITSHTAQIRQLLATYATDEEYTTLILRAVGSIEATAKRATAKSI